jgi:hypothetical protein
MAFGRSPHALAGYYTMWARQHNCLTAERMAKVPLTEELLKTGKIVLNLESVGLSPEQFFRLCSDNPELRLEMTAQNEVIVMAPTNSKTGGFLIYTPKRQVFVYRPDEPVVRLDNPASVSGDPELPGFILDLTEIWK